jgi:signal transduction histidine kinase
MTRSTNDRLTGGPDVLPLRPPVDEGRVTSLLEKLVAEVIADRRARRLPPVPVVLDGADSRIAPADAEPLRQAVAPLVAAACEAAATASPRLREVVITTVDTTAAIEIEIADSGAGSPPSALAAVRSPVERLGGTIACTRCPEGGLAVTLRLPRHRLKTRAA